MLHFLRKVFGITYKNPPEELGEVETQDDSNVKFTWETPIDSFSPGPGFVSNDYYGTKFTTGSDNVFRDIGCDNPEELLEQAEVKYANEYLSEAAINSVDLFNEIHLQETAERKDLARLKELFSAPTTLGRAPEIILNHLSKRQLIGILGTTENALKETKDKLEKADLKFTIKTIKAILKEKTKSDK
jgi:hypothetical protein